MSKSNESRSGNRLPLALSVLTLLALAVFLTAYQPASSHTLPQQGSSSPTPCPLAWDVIPSPARRDARDVLLNAISASSPTDAWTVGTQNLDGSITLLTQHWDGATWTIVPGPDYYQSHLYGVTALSPDNAWAVGSYDAFTYSPPLALHWDGSAWNEVPIPNPAPGPGHSVTLHDITAVGANPDDIWAVGNYGQGSLIEHWDGTEWSLIFTDSISSNLVGVAAVSSNDVWAVGETPGETSFLEDTFVKHWDGTEWTTVSSPNPEEGTGNHLTSVAAISANDVWAVGYKETVEDGGLAMHWDGSAWSIVPVPGGMQLVSLNGVAGGAADDVWAVGIYGIYPGRHTLVLHWDGTQWAQVYSPSISPDWATLNSVDVDSEGNAWSAGYYYFRSGSALPKPLVERYRPGMCCQPGFTDVQSSDYFYEAVRHLYCNGAISGYADGTFLPYNSATRGQLTKIVVLAKGWPIDVTDGPHFSDVLKSNPFYDYIETAYNHNIISGYTDGTFRWGNDITRAQLCKVIVLAQQWPLVISKGPHFSDVPLSNPFYDYIETAYHYSIVSGYSDGTFRPGNNATRGQISTIVYYAIVQP